MRLEEFKTALQLKYERKQKELEELEASLDYSQIDTQTANEIKAKKEYALEKYKEAQDEIDKKIKECEESINQLRLLPIQNEKARILLEKQLEKQEKAIESIYHSDSSYYYFTEMALDATFDVWKYAIRNVSFKKAMARMEQELNCYQKDLDRQIHEQNSPFMLQLLATPMPQGFIVVAGAVLLAMGVLTLGPGLITMGATLIGIGLFSAGISYLSSKNEPIGVNNNLLNPY